MIVDSLENAVRLVNENKNLNFDISSVPVFPEAPTSKFQPNTNGMFITKQSQKKDLAFQVIAYLLSPEYQTELSKQGLISPLMDPAVQQAFGQQVPQWQGKRTASVYHLQSAMPPGRKPGLTFIHANMDFIWGQIANESKDTQTALRMGQAEMDKAIREAREFIRQGGVNPHE